MRSFIISVIIIATIITLSLVNCYATRTITQELFAFLSKLEIDESLEAYNDYTLTWKKYTFFFDTTLPKHKSELIIEGMAIIEASLHEHDASAFKHGIILSRSAIKSIAESNEINLKNIL